MATTFGHTNAVNIIGDVGQRSRSTDAINLAASRQGALISQDQILQWTLDGRVFHAQQGNAATQVDFAETAYDEDQPQFALTVPTGRTVIPLSLVVSLEDQAGTDTLVTWSRTSNDIGVGTSTSLTVSSLRSDSPHSTTTLANSLYTGNATAATGLIEVIRWVDPFALEAASSSGGRYEWSALTSAVIPILVGPATLQMHVSSTTTAPQGFGEYVWVDFETPDLVTKA